MYHYYDKTKLKAHYMCIPIPVELVLKNPLYFYTGLRVIVLHYLACTVKYHELSRYVFHECRSHECNAVP